MCRNALAVLSGRWAGVPEGRHCPPVGRSNKQGFGSHQNEATLFTQNVATQTG